MSAEKEVKKNCFIDSENGAAGCSCCHHDSRFIYEKKWYKNRDFYEIMLGTIVFVTAQWIVSYSLLYQLILLIMAYLILGREILLAAVTNILKGHIFDENFLMSIATLGAFAIGEYPEAVGVMLFFRIGEFFEEKAASNSRKQIIAAVDMRPETVLLLDENDTARSVPAEQVKLGDIILVRPGDRIPLDGRIVEGSSQIDTSPLTGEIKPWDVYSGKDVLSGCINKSGVIKIRVEKILEDSMVSRILESVQSASANKPRIQRFISRFAQIYTPFVVGAAVMLAVIPSLITGQWHTYVYIALTFLVISCPCALVLSVPLAFFSGIGAASRQGILFKDGAAIEALSQVKTAALDKTGTITQGVFAVQQIQTYNGFSSDEVLRLGAAAEYASVHPLAGCIVKAAQQLYLAEKRASTVREIAGKGVVAEVEKKEIVAGNLALMREKGIDVENAVEGTIVYLAVSGVYAGCIIMGDKLKDDAGAALKKLQQLSVTAVMLTGDAEEGALSVAAKVGIKKIYSKLLPEDKLAALQKIRHENGKVLFVGDGINDAPVLANADVGAAMGSGADAAIEAADIVFMTAKVTAIPQSIILARSVRNIAIQNVIFALGIKLLVMLCGILGYASLWSAVFADTGVAMLCVLNSVRILYKKYI
ncbi:heavy metal translocating P-type ATPase [Pectinatus frisingensis]|uniref:heavy metal translocating P-type ATPase n=1 Tax=Pectinatus frisingensis TaxID=865 RepID=UPI0018C47C86|nr:heavy metal translocating P-type ATPase [Pectinatus frisingensis]